jgi:LmbE family N-acetylglucosaminyl deacetylase
LTPKTRTGLHSPPIAASHEPMRWIYISPHFDDAVLSCGGLIRKQTRKGIPVEIWTLCAGDAPPGPLSLLAMACHFQWGIESAEDVVAARRLENQHASALVGAETVDFSIPDCIYRRSAEGELLYTEDVFVACHPSEKELHLEIAEALKTELQAGDVIVSPFSIGGHIDHVMARAAAESLERPLRYYADIPYLLNQPEQLAPLANGLKGTPHRITEKDLGTWQDGIALYATQMVMLFETVEKMREAIRSYWAEQRGVRLWDEG